MSNRRAQELEAAWFSTARFPKGEPADPTVNMSEEDAAMWWDMNEEYGDMLKQAGNDRFEELWRKKYLWLPNIFEAELSEKSLSIKKGLESMGFGTKLDTTIGMLTASSIRGHYENVIKVEFIFPVGEDKRVLSALRNKVPPAGGVFITATPILPSRKKPYTTPPMTPIWRNIYRMILDLRGKDLSDTRDSRWDDPRFQK